MPDKAPWDDDLAATFADEDIREQVSEFLGEKVQPYVTKVEQEAAPNRDASALWEQINDQPAATSIQITRELFGPEIADAYAELLQKGVDPGDATEIVTKAVEDEDGNTKTVTEAHGVKFEDLPVEVQEDYAQRQQERQAKSFQAEVDRVITEHKDELTPEGSEAPVFEKELFNPFVVAAEGDFDKAYEAFTAFKAQAKEQWGIKIPSPDNAAPPVIDSTTRTSGTKPPQAAEYKSLDEAMDAFFDEVNAPPPTVG